MNFKNALPLLGLAYLFAGGASAQTVSINVALEWDPGVATNSVGVLVVDKDQNGFAGISGPDISTINLKDRSLAVNQIFGADDLIVGLLQTGNPSFDGGGDRGLENLINSIPLTGGVDAGDPLAVYWFDDPASDPVTVGQTFGFYRTDTLDPASLGNIAFVMPAAGGAKDLFAFSNTITFDGGSATNADFIANNGTVIPEPSGVALIALGGLLFVRRRRR